MDDAAIVGKAHAVGLHVFQGFLERAYRLVFESEAAGAEPKWVETILTCGDVEMQKKFQPKKGKGLITFAHPQDIQKIDARKYIKRPEGPGYFIHHDDAPDSCAYPLVQAWTVNVNDNFRREYDIMTEDQIQGEMDRVVHADAIFAFRKSMAKCFSSAEVDKYGIKCCRMKQWKENKHLVVTGPRGVLEAFTQNPDVQKYFFITADQHGFRAWSKPKGKWFPQSQRFEWGLDMKEVYVLYTRTGNSEMTCMMKRQQFVREKNLGQELTAELRCPEEPTIRHTLDITNEQKQESKLDLEGLDPMSIDVILGKGAFSVVVLVHSQAQRYALKMLKLGRKTSMKLEHLGREEEIRKFLGKEGPRCPFFVKTFSCFQLPKDVVWETSGGEAMPADTYSVGVLLEYIEGGTLSTAITYDITEKPKSLERFIKYRRWAAEVAKAMQFLHSLDIAYQKLMPENVMLKPMPHKQRSFACLGDWGFAKNTELWGSAESDNGETLFVAPEVPQLKLLEQKNVYTLHCDVFSFGRMLKAMIACTLEETDIVSNEFPNDFPESARALVIRTTIELPAAQRGTFEEICDHPFFGEVAFGSATVPPINFSGLVQDASAAR